MTVLERLKELDAKATRGPWKRGGWQDNAVSQARDDGGANPLGYFFCPAFAEDSPHGRECIANSELAALSRTHLAALIAAAEALRAVKAVDPFGIIDAAEAWGGRTFDLGEAERGMDAALAPLLKEE